MKNKYLDKMLTQPDYVVVYDVDKNFYHGDTLGKEDYKKLQYDMNIYDTKVKMLIGYAASKSHPNDPVKVYISLDMRDYSGKRLEHNYIRVSKVINGYSEHYEGKHNLFIYSDYSMAILAGKEMAFIDSVDEYIETVGSKFAEYFPDTKFNRNFDFKWLQDKFNICKDRGYLNEKMINDTIKNLIKTAKDNVKNHFDVNANDVTNYVQSGIERFLNELNKANKDIKQPSKDFAKKEDFALYKQLTDEYAVLLKHRNKNGQSHYTVNITKSFLSTSKTYDITFEQFCDIYEILNEDAEGRLKLSSIMDILGNTVVINEKHVEVVKEKPKKTHPIQFCQFRAEDEIPSEPRPGKAKFNVGDKVYNKSKGYGTIISISDAKTNDGKKRKLYKVQFGGNTGELNIWNAWSYELEKA